MFVFPRNESFWHASFFSLEGQGGIGKTDGGLSIVTKNEQAGSGRQIQSDDFCAMQPKTTEVKNSVSFQIQRSSVLPEKLCATGPTIAPLKHRPERTIPVQLEVVNK